MVILWRTVRRRWWLDRLYGRFYTISHSNLTSAQEEKPSFRVSQYPSQEASDPRRAIPRTTTYNGTCSTADISEHS